MLERFAAEGVTVVVCTPHLDASMAHDGAGGRARGAARGAAAARAPAGLTLRTGWEIQLDLPGVDLTSPALHLGGSTAALVEFHNMTVPPNSAKEIYPPPDVAAWCRCSRTRSATAARRWSSWRSGAAPAR